MRYLPTGGARSRPSCVSLDTFPATEIDEEHAAMAIDRIIEHNKRTGYGSLCPAGCAWTRSR